MFLPLRRARWPLHTKMGRICKVAVEMTRRINRGESQTGYSPALGNPHQTRVPTFPQRRRRRGAWQRRGQTPLKSGSLPDSCTEPNKLCRCGLELGDPRLVFLQLVFVPAELLGTDGVLLLERLDSFHDAVSRLSG